jgi:hypothetical protein
VNGLLRQRARKAKFDDQIVAIAAVEGATTIYCDDEDIAKLAEGRFGVIKVAAIPLPPESASRQVGVREERSRGFQAGALMGHFLNTSVGFEPTTLRL